MLRNVLFASSNTQEFLNCSPQDLFLGPLEDYFGEKVLHAMRNVAGQTTISTHREAFATTDLGRGLMELSAHRRGDRFIVECMPVGSESETGGVLNSTRAALACLQLQEDLGGFLRMAVQALRVLTNYDRVMAYRFLPDESGEVVAESCSSVRESFLGLRYPAWDIPKQARELYKTTPIRFIADVQESGVALLAANPGIAPLDMSLAVLRGTSPVHIEYLRNMGVAATMSLPIIVDDKLWGLFACHHYAPRFPSPHLIKGCEIAGVISGALIEKAVHRRADAIREKVAETSIRISSRDSHSTASSEYWQALMRDMRQLVDSDGVIQSIDKQVTFNGIELPAAALSLIRHELAASETSYVAFNDLRQRFPHVNFGEVAGALCLAISESPQVVIVFVRRAIQQTIRWAGAPQKTVVTTATGVRLSPRGSFDAYIEEATDRCDEWTSDELQTAKAIQVAVRQAMVVEDSRRLEILVHELNHRVRNILSLVRSLAHQTKDSSDSIDQYTKGLEERLVSLAKAHDLLTQSSEGGISVEKLLASELAPYFRGESSGAKLTGPLVKVRADAGSMFALVVHELTSNAAKYGALSAQGGTLTVNWNKSDGGLAVRWRESGGPPLKAPTRTGFGMTIIEKTFPHEFDGKAECKFTEGGFHADLWLPKRFVEFEVKRGSDDVSLPQAEPAVPTVARKVGPKRALVLEDSFLIAAELDSLLRSIGFENVDVVANNADALSCINRSSYSLAVLDLNLKGEMSVPVANELQSDGTPFLFVTGYGSAESLPKNLQSSKVLIKPLLKAELVKHVQQLGID
jgi:light-regulated signal transduction histidine kinase (bacteriophytochrome)